MNIVLQVQHHNHQAARLLLVQQVRVHLVVRQKVPQVRQRLAQVALQFLVVLVQVLLAH